MRETLAFATCMFVVLCILESCKATCAVIDLANQACPLVVQYTDKTGAKRTTTITNDDAVGLAAIKSSRDGGVP